MRKIAVLACITVLVIAGTAFAEEPVSSLSLTQEMDTGIVDNEAEGNYLTDGDTLYLSSEAVAGVTFGFSAFSIKPWISGLYETGDGAYHMGTATVGVDTSFPVSEMFNVYFNLSMAWEIESGAELTPYLTPVLGFSGVVAGISYDLSGDAVFYFTDDGTDVDIEATLEAEYTLPIDISLMLTDEFVYELAMLEDEDPALTNDLSVLLAYSVGPLTTSVGPVFDLALVDGEQDVLLIGFKAGVDISINTWSFGLSYTGGKEFEENEMIGAFSAVLGLEL